MQQVFSLSGREFEMSYSLAMDGDAREQEAGKLFLQSEFPSYEKFWLKHVVPLTNRPVDIHFKDDTRLAAEGHTPEDIAIAQLHYTVLKHLLSTHSLRQIANPNIDEFVLFVGLSSLCGAQDVAFEVLERYTERGIYDPWLEKRRKKGPKSGQDAQANWRSNNNYPLQDIRDYRNKLLHGRTPPVIIDQNGMRLPGVAKVDQYSDWRHVTDPAKAASLRPNDFE
ncbi:MAG: hypothetical protein HY760_07110, partial [Nitrospirae bacterium]|nr:hypothetical protein [Nitrospirota bacterium]